VWHEAESRDPLDQGGARYAQFDGDAPQDRLSAIERLFLAQEGKSSHSTWARSHFEAAAGVHDVINQSGAAPSGAALPQKLGHPRFEMAAALDRRSTFNIDTTCATRAPGAGSTSTAPARRRIFSQRLDRSKPLWSCGSSRARGQPLRADQQTHHALVDGVSAWTSPRCCSNLAPVPQQRRARRLAPRRAVSGRADRRGAKSCQAAVRHRFTRHACAHPPPRHWRPPARRSRASASGLAGLNPAPETPLNVPIGHTGA